jgi:indolepyruvate ferredoxin oxidoreductase beta subunit
VTEGCTNIVIVGVGGQGIVLLTRILGEAAMASDLNVMESEIHGMAQRGGMVTSTIRIGDAKSPMIGRGEADVILGLEPVEAYRHLDMASLDTIIITSVNAVYPFTVTSGDEEYPDVDKLIDGVGSCAGKLVKMDAEKIAKDTDLPNIVSNMIMLGAMFGAYPEIPIALEKVKEAISNSVPSKYLEENIRAFEIGYSSSVRIGLSKE